MVADTQKNDKMDLITRGQYGPDPIGVILWVGLRGFDGFVLQRMLQMLGPSLLPSRFSSLSSPSSVLAARLLGQQAKSTNSQNHYPLSTRIYSVLNSHAFFFDLTSFEAIIWAMSILAAVKQIFWYLYVSNEPLGAKNVIGIALFNTIFNSFNTLAFSLFAHVNPTWSETTFYLSIPLFVSGILIETVSEIQRKQFKNDPRNKGKLYSAGLFGYARSVNYFGYTVWRASFALAGGGWCWSALVAAFFTYDFTQRAIPVMEEYCSRKYGTQWREVKKRVPSAFFPGVY